MNAVRFDEVMTGTISPREQSSALPLAVNTPFTLRLRVAVTNMHRFLAESDHSASLSGWVDCAALGGRLPVERGTCSFFPRGVLGRGSGLRYWLMFTDGADSPWTLLGDKYLRAGAPARVWVDTTTLYARLLHGHLAADDSQGREADVAVGVLRIHPLAFAKELTTFRAGRARALLSFLRFFVGGLWEAYFADGWPHREVRARGEYR